jgi:hypothetical protein
MKGRLDKHGNLKPWYSRPPWKQPVDQFLHTVWGFGIGICLGSEPLFAVPLAGYLFGREQQQGKSARRFDPHLDWTFYFLGVYLGWTAIRLIIAR